MLNTTTASKFNKNVLRILTIISAIFILQQKNLEASETKFDFKKLDQYFETLEENNRFMGSVAITKDQKNIYSKIVGMEDVEQNEKADRHTKYRIGSTTKTFTAVLTMKAVEDEKISLQQTIDYIYPEIINSDKITIENLLNHRSGIHSFTNDPEFFSWNTEEKSRSEILDLIINTKSDFEPGTQAQYSNSNYILLSFILEKAYGESYGTLLKRYITKPAKMKATFYGSEDSRIRCEAKSYRYYGNWKEEPVTDLSVPLGAGAIISTSKDLAKFFDALFAGKLINKTSLDKMKTLKDRFGYGIFEINFDDKKATENSGVIDGFNSTILHFENEEISLAIISNGTNYQFPKIRETVLKAIFNLHYDIPSFSSYTANPETFGRFVGTYSTKDLPFKINIIKSDNVLLLEANGMKFPFEATAENNFKIDQIGATIEFLPNENKMIYQQNGTSYTLTK